MKERTEKDALGKKQIPEKALYGIHSLRARENFPDSTAFHIEWFKALGTVKSACYKTYLKFTEAAERTYQPEEIPIRLMDEKLVNGLIRSAEAVSEGRYFNDFIVPAISGGAGTSINMNVNEILTNSALLELGRKPGEYKYLDPIEHANVFQSTNDVVPTSLRIAVMRLLVQLQDSINRLRKPLEELEKKHRDSLRIGYTQMQEAVPTSFGKLFSIYCEALSRDWWRVSKSFERIKTVNLGGSAIGTGITVPRFFIFEVIPVLRQLTGLPVTRSENLEDATSNLDSLVEVHAILKAHAVNLEKIASDFRMLAADLNRGKELSLPQKQVGSSVIPGKINPVIPEFVIGSCHKIYSNDQLMTSLSGQGCLELNAYLPAIGHALIESIKLLFACNKTMAENLVTGLKINTESALHNLYHSPSITTALIPYAGYHKSAKLAKIMKDKSIDVFKASAELGLINEVLLKKILEPDELLKLGYSLSEIGLKDS